MKATDLKSVLSDLADIFRAGGGNSSATDVELLADRIDTSCDRSADAALDLLEAELLEISPTPATPERYIVALHEAGLSESAFLKVFAQIKNDKSIKKADAIEIMKGYAGEYKRAKTKSDAIESIERRFTELVYDDNAHRQAANTTPW
ncbi:MAG: hypothetical protein AAFQ35_05620 [Pseudomonadota bacterium]